MSSRAPHCPITGKPVLRTLRPGHQPAQVLCRWYEVETGFCRLEVQLPRVKQWRRLLEALDAADAGEGVHCVME